MRPHLPVAAKPSAAGCAHAAHVLASVCVQPNMACQHTPRVNCNGQAEELLAAPLSFTACAACTEGTRQGMLDPTTLKKSDGILGPVIDNAMCKEGVQDPVGHGSQQVLHHSHKLGLGVQPASVDTALHQRLQSSTSTA